MHSPAGSSKADLRLLAAGLVVLLALVFVSAAAAATRYDRVNAAVSPYLSAMVDRPSMAHDRAAIAKTNARLVTVARGASTSCRRQILKVRRAVARTDLGAKAKRTRILDAVAPTYYRC